MEKAKFVVIILAVIYKKLLRAELMKLVEKTESPVDDQVIVILDKLLLEVDTSIREVSQKEGKQEKFWILKKGTQMEDA